MSSMALSCPVIISIIAILFAYQGLQTNGDTLERPERTPIFWSSAPAPPRVPRPIPPPPAPAPGTGKPNGEIKDQLSSGTQEEAKNTQGNAEDNSIRSPPGNGVQNGNQTQTNSTSEVEHNANDFEGSPNNSVLADNANGGKVTITTTVITEGLPHAPLANEKDCSTEPCKNNMNGRPLSYSVNVYVDGSHVHN